MIAIAIAIADGRRRQWWWIGRIFGTARCHWFRLFGCGRVGDGQARKEIRHYDNIVSGLNQSQLQAKRVCRLTTMQEIMRRDDVHDDAHEDGYLRLRMLCFSSYYYSLGLDSPLEPSCAVL